MRDVEKVLKNSCKDLEELLQAIEEASDEKKKEKELKEKVERLYTVLSDYLSTEENKKEEKDLLIRIISIRSKELHDNLLKLVPSKSH